MGVGESISGLAYQFGLPGIFVAAVIANATVFVVVPIVEVVVVSLAAAKVYSPLLLGIFAGSGAGIGEMTGYLVGRGGEVLLERMQPKEREILHKVEKKLRENKWKGTFIILGGAIIPFPFDLIGLASGLVKFPWQNFFIAAIIGKTIRFTLLAYAAAIGMESLVNFLLH